MQTEQPLTFGPYRFEPPSGQLWRGTQEVRLTAKATALLQQLVAHAGQVVTKDELFRLVWPNAVVSDAALTSCIQELRQALHDNARKARYIETVHRRGFRFLGKVISDQSSVVSPKEGPRGWRLETSPFSLPTAGAKPLVSTIVGRESDLAFLHARLANAVHGERQLIFVTGEPGIGKTTLIDIFVSSIRRQAEASAPASSLLPPHSRLFGWAGGSALSTTEPGKRICQSWKPWVDCVVSLKEGG
jgi:DNA-binding winged helix-turn-helix (wHTH) protein